jgi:hypothetical protein
MWPPETAPFGIPSCSRGRRWAIARATSARVVKPGSEASSSEMENGIHTSSTVAASMQLVSHSRIRCETRRMPGTVEGWWSSKYSWRKVRSRNSGSTSSSLKPAALNSATASARHGVRVPVREVGPARKMDGNAGCGVSS